MIRDRFERPLRSLRISVTDRCNLRCEYCMPEAEYVWLPREFLLRFEEIERLVRVFTRLGLRRIRLTGGEPLLRRELDGLVGRLAGIPAVEDLALTTNGVLLPGLAGPLRAAGLRRVTVSLDTLRPERFERSTRSGRHAEVIAGIDAAGAAGFESVKINTVVIRGFNDDEIADLVGFGRGRGAEVRFIEYMDVGGANRWSPDRVVSRAEILAALEARLGPILPVGSDGAAPAERFLLPDGTRFGVIASTTAPFCGTCDRSRLTADGIWYMCLYAPAGLDLRTPLREGEDDAAIAARIEARWKIREDRGAEARLGISGRQPLHPVEHLRRDPHLEMHTRGG